VIDWLLQRKSQERRNEYFRRQLEVVVTGKDRARAFVDSVLSTGIIPVEIEASGMLVDHIKELRAEIRLLRAQLDEAKAKATQ
jgi:Zn-dependent membrane protease YugP